MATAQQSTSRASAFARMGNPIVNRLLGAGFQMGPNAILTVRGRTSGACATMQNWRPTGSGNKTPSCVSCRSLRGRR